MSYNNPTPEELAREVQEEAALRDEMAAEDNTPARERGTITMYLPHVQMRREPTGLVAARVIKPTLEAAKAVLDAEVARAGRPELMWDDAFGGSTAFQGELAYEVQPVVVSFNEEVDPSE